MDFFKLKNGTTYCEDVKLNDIAQEVGTPAYIYSASTLDRHCKKFFEAFSTCKDFLPCYAVKANSTIKLLKRIFSHGFGADVVSIGEIERAILAGCPPEKIVFSGVGKKPEEIVRALELGIFSFNVESTSELDTIDAIAGERKIQARISLRVNPNVDAKTNPYIATGLYSSKFGIALDASEEVFEGLKARPNLKLVGVSCHIGSQMTELGPLSEAVASMRSLIDSLLEKGHPLEFIDMGGGLGIKYKNEVPPSLEEYAKVLVGGLSGTGLKLIVEPGRVLVGNMGVLLTKVMYIKTNPQKTFVIVDAAMNDLLRPSIYKSYHEILPVDDDGNKKTKSVDVVGPVCESGDFFAQDRELKFPEPNENLFVRSCGAYASSMAFNYNSRTKSPEVLVEGDKYEVIRRRELTEELWRLETL